MTDSCYNYSEKQEFQKMEFLDTVKLAFSKHFAKSLFKSFFTKLNLE